MRKLTKVIPLGIILYLFMLNLPYGYCKGIEELFINESDKEGAEAEILTINNGAIVNYLIEAQLHPDIRKLSGVETVSWRNPSSGQVDRLQFHLCYNAFRNFNTTFMKQKRFLENFSTLQAAEKFNFGEIKIKDISLIGGENLIGNLQYISPDDYNSEDKTVMEINLNKPILPGETILIKIKFILTIPQIFSRTGKADDFFFMALWFPKIGVLQNNGEWNCHQFHHNSEVFSNYGNYRVWLNLPEKYVIGATGNLISMEQNADNTITYFYEEKDIHDFAWAASPYFKKFTDEVMLTGNDEKTVIEFFLSPEHTHIKERYINSLKFALNFYEKKIYPYPYKKITLIDYPYNLKKSNGMEYPGLITTCYNHYLPNSNRQPEIEIIHGIGHQYWHCIVGADGSREAWLSEGVNGFFELEILDEYFKDAASYLDTIFFKIDNWEIVRYLYSNLLPLSPVDQYSWKFLNSNQYYGNVSAKVAILLRSLKNLVNKEQMENFFKFYAEKYKLKHPNSEDFFETFNTFMSEEFSWAFEQFIQAEQTLDHLVYSIESEQISLKPVIYRNEVVFLRKEGYFPVELLLTLENGKEIKSFWKEKESWKKITIEDQFPIKFAAIDPLNKIPLDRNFLNNSKVLEPKTSGFLRLSMKIGFIFQNLLGLLAF